MAKRLLEIDRVTQAKRPDRPIWGTQRWRQLLFMHWPMPAAALRRMVPRAFELDLHEGTAYVGVVPFAMQGVRPSFLPARLSLDFLETNVRTYVLYKGEPGVYFFSLEAASRLAVAAARATFALPYHFATMRLEQARDLVHYRSQRLSDGATLGVKYRVGDALGPSLPGTLQHFLIERYLLFTEREGSTLRGQVHHEAYPVYQAEVLDVRDRLVDAAGLPPLVGLPTFSHYSPGVDVDVFAIEAV